MFLKEHNLKNMIKYLRVEVKSDGEIQAGGSIIGYDSYLGKYLSTKEEIANEKIYVRSNGEEIFVKDMPIRHLIYAYAKAVRKDEKEGQKIETPVLDMLRDEIERRVNEK